MFNTLDIRHQLLFFQSTKGAPASISPTTAADPSHSFRITFYRESRFYQTKRLWEIRHMEKESLFYSSLPIQRHLFP